MLFVYIIIAIAVVLLILGMTLQYKKVGPNEVLIITGGRRRTITLPDGTKKKVGYRLRIGGGTFILPLFESYQTLQLQNIPMDFEIQDVIAHNGIRGIISGTAQVKINGAEPEVHLAAEQFLGKSINDVRDISLKTLEGHVRSIIGTVDLEYLNKSRRDFNASIFEEVLPEFNRMGLQLISFNLKEIKDPTGYLEALGRPVIARAKRDAEVAQAEANRDGTIKSSEAKKLGDIAKLRAEIDVAEATRDFELRKAEFQANINEKKAISDYTYDLERFRMSQKVKEEEHKVKILEKNSAIDLAKLETSRIEHDLESKVKQPATAERFRLIQEAEAMAEAKKIQGKIEAELTESQGEAEAKAMKMKAEAWANYNNAALTNQLLEMMPALAREIAEPISKIEKIVMVNSGTNTSGMSKLTGDVAEVLAQLPTVIESLSGVDLKGLLKKLPSPQNSGSQLTDANEGTSPKPKK
ncbi:flotillin [bacterium]|nr:flotillin [bacterium]